MKLKTTAFLPFAETLFRTLWLAAFISNIGTWMQNVGVGWLAATFSASPFLIAMIQTASALPSLLFSYLAGVIADQMDRRKLLVWLQILLFAVVFFLSLLTFLKLLNMNILLVFTFLIGLGTAFTTPVWQAITPEVVSPNLMKEAIALNGVNFNLSRAIGPAIGGIILSSWGIQAIFLINALSFLFLAIGLLRWHDARKANVHVTFRTASREGLKEVRKSVPFRLLLVRTIAFTAFVSAFFALLPQLSKYIWAQDSSQYTWLWAAVGAGALVGSYLYGLWGKYIGAGTVVFGSCLLIAVCFIGFTLVSTFWPLMTTMFVLGIGWINATSTLNVMAQENSPAAFKARFLAVNVTVFQGGLAISSAWWGWLSNHITSLMALRWAGIGMAICAILINRFMPVESKPLPGDAVACADPLLQYQLDEPSQ
ncbi:MFS transporter [Mucilaginibacter angelicae]|uniref:MFS transporter n=1 Tax=Mucilaginibacter angelicae TaxID=869718 RepID=A0ABV6L047_9SPHI